MITLKVELNVVEEHRLRCRFIVDGVNSNSEEEMIAGELLRRFEKCVVEIADTGTRPGIAVVKETGNVPIPDAIQTIFRQPDQSRS